MALGDVGMMRGGVCVASFVACSSFAMVACCVLMMFRGLAVMLDG
jgi:hypothetical protein